MKYLHTLDAGDVVELVALHNQPPIENEGQPKGKPAYILKVIAESLRDDLLNGIITEREAAEELYRNGQFNYIPDAMEVKRRLGVN